MFLIFTANTNKSQNVCTPCKLMYLHIILYISLTASLFLLIAAVTETLTVAQRQSSVAGPYDFWLVLQC